MTLGRWLENGLTPTYRLNRLVYVRVLVEFSNLPGLPVKIAVRVRDRQAIVYRPFGLFDCMIMRVAVERRLLDAIEKALPPRGISAKAPYHIKAFSLPFFVVPISVN